jgi:hypothetical protein
MLKSRLFAMKYKIEYFKPVVLFTIESIDQEGEESQETRDKGYCEGFSFECD